MSFYNIDITIHFNQFSINFCFWKRNAAKRVKVAPNEAALISSVNSIFIFFVNFFRLVILYLTAYSVLVFAKSLNISARSIRVTFY